MRCLLASLLVFGCSGGVPLSDQELNEVVAAQSESLGECAGASMEELTLVLTISASGEVEDARASGSPRIAACVERVAKTWTFPTAETGVEASLPLTITPAPVVQPEDFEEASE